MESNEAPERLGRYRILKEIGRGGMATVYHAVQEGPHGFENHVALKLIHERLLAAYPRVVKMLVDEARVAARINHPNVMRILDLVEQENRVYMVMDFVDGVSMRGVLDHARETHTRTPIEPIIEVLAAACDGIHAAHQLKSADGTHLSLVHRDMKPGNIMVSTDGHVKVGDFGIALFADRVADATAQGQLKGTPAYMSPEQTLGGPLDARSDVFSMGLTLYTLATTKLAFRARKAMHIALKIARESLEPHAVELDAIGEGLGDVLRRACARDPDDRFPDAASLGDALREVRERLDGETTIPQMLAATGWQAGPLDPDAALQEDSLDPEDSEPSHSPLPAEPIDDPEERELTQTVGAEQTEMDTDTYIPTVTELNTDLDATPISSPRPDLVALAPAPDKPPPGVSLAPGAETQDSAQETEVLTPAQRDAATITAPVPTIAGLIPPAAGAGPQLTEPSGGLVLHERDYRGRVVSGTPAERTRIGVGEKLGVSIAVAFLVVTIVAIVSFQLLSPSGEEEPVAGAEVAALQAEQAVLPGGVAIAEPQDSGGLDGEGASGPGSESAAERAASAGSDEIGIEEEPEAVGSDEEAEALTIEEETAEPAASPPTAAPVQAPTQRPAAVAAAPRPAAASRPAARAASKAEGSGAAPETAAEPAAPGKITVSSYPWSEVYIDGIKVGVIPLQEHSIPAGIHTIRLVFPSLGNQEIVEKIEVRPGKHVRFVKKLNPPAANSGN
jgi:serine/threonine-protein kinase